MLEQSPESRRLVEAALGMVQKGRRDQDEVIKDGAGVTVDTINRSYGTDPSTLGGFEFASLVDKYPETFRSLLGRARLASAEANAEGKEPLATGTLGDMLNGLE